MVMLKEHLCNPINYQVFAFYSNDPSSNPAEVYTFSAEIVVLKRTIMSKKEAGICPFL